MNVIHVNFERKDTSANCYVGGENYLKSLHKQRQKLTNQYIHVNEEEKQKLLVEINKLDKIIIPLEMEL